MLSNTSNCCRDTNFNALDNIRYFEHEKEERRGHCVRKLLKSLTLVWAKVASSHNSMCLITSRGSSHEWKMCANILLLYAASIHIFNHSSTLALYRRRDFFEWFSNTVKRMLFRGEISAHSVGEEWVKHDFSTSRLGLSYAKAYLLCLVTNGLFAAKAR